MTRSRVLDQTDLFGQMPPDLLSELSGRTELSKYRRNETICEQGEVAERMFIVFSGRVAITVKATDGRESVVAVLGPGAIFGELPLFDGATRSADARGAGGGHERVPHRDDGLASVAGPASSARFARPDDRPGVRYDRPPDLVYRD